MAYIASLLEKTEKIVCRAKKFSLRGRKFTHTIIEVGPAGGCEKEIDSSKNILLDIHNFDLASRLPATAFFIKKGSIFTK